MLVTAPLASAIYDQPQVGTLIAIVATTMLFEPYGVVTEAELQVSLRFRALAGIRAITALVRYGTSVGLAVAGFGPLSFVLPLIPVGVLRCLLGFLLTRQQPWSQRPRSLAMSEIFRSSRWVMFGTFGSVLYRQIDYLVLGLVSTTATVGVYFFAYQLSIQPVLLFSQSLRRVLVPAFSRVDSDRPRQQRAVIRAGAVIGLGATMLFLYVALVADTIESFVWQGKWARSVPLIRVFAAVMPMHLFALFTRMIIQARGRFQLWGWIVFARSGGLAIVVALAARIRGGDDLLTIAWCVAIYLAIGSVGEAIFIMTREKIDIAPLLSVVLPPYLFTLGVVALLNWITNGLFSEPDFQPAALKTALYVPICILAANTFFRATLNELRTVVDQFMSRSAND